MVVTQYTSKFSRPGCHNKTLPRNYVTVSLADCPEGLENCEGLPLIISLADDAF